MPNLKSLESLRRRICTIIDIGTADDLISRAYDIFYTLVILVNLVVTIAYTFDEAEAACGPLLLRIEAATVAFFAVDCALRIWTAKYHHPNLKEWKAVCRYIFSFSGIVDLLSFLPYYMPFFFPSGARGLPDVPGCTDLPPVPDQRLLRFPERYYPGPYQQGPAASLLRVYHSGADDRLQFVYVLSGA